MTTIRRQERKGKEQLPPTRRIEETRSEERFKNKQYTIHMRGRRLLYIGQWTDIQDDDW